MLLFESWNIYKYIYFITLLPWQLFNLLNISIRFAFSFSCFLFSFPFLFFLCAKLFSFLVEDNVSMKVDVKMGLNWSANEIFSSVSYLNVRANFINRVNLFAYFIAHHVYYLFKWHCTIIYRGQFWKIQFQENKISDLYLAHTILVYFVNFRFHWYRLQKFSEICHLYAGSYFCIFIW